MSLTEFEKEKVRMTMEEFLSKRRPPEDIRNQVDLSYRIDGQSVEIFEIRELWNRPKEKIEASVAKATYVRTKNHWKVFWMRADMKWHGYEPNKTVKTLEEFTAIIDKDEYGCFWG